MLSVRNLQVRFKSQGGEVRAVENMSFNVGKGEIVAIVGESGCGKSALAMSILRLNPEPPCIVTGQIRFGAIDLFDLSEKEMQSIRGNQIGMIFQEPMTSLNPVLTVGSQIAEVLEIHQKLQGRRGENAAAELLHAVGIPEAKSRVKEYPFQLSGGMRQRVMIALAIACRPNLLIADEPTTALDVTIQAQILKLLLRLRAEVGSAMLLITHDLGVVAEIADRVIVMYAGSRVEEASVAELFANPKHPYTKGLLGAMPRLGSSSRSAVRTRLTEIPGIVPTRREAPKGCNFADRCPNVTDICRNIIPEPVSVSPSHKVACHHAVEVVAS